MEVALEGMQCLGGNGYINGESEYFHRTPTSPFLKLYPRLSYEPYCQRLQVIYGWGWYTGDSTDADW